MLDTAKFLKKYNLHGPDFDDTPQRVERLWEDFFNIQAPKMTKFPTHMHQGLVLNKNYEDWGFCPHHLLPVKYTFKIGYIPNKFVLGASKPCRIASYVLRGLPLQENIGKYIIDGIVEAIDPKAIGVIIQGEHLCMRMRGIESPCVDLVTSDFWGLFLTDPSAKEEFLLL